MYIAIISFPVDDIINLKLILALKLTIINFEIKNYPRSQKNQDKNMFGGHQPAKTQKHKHYLVLKLFF